MIKMIVICLVICANGFLAGCKSPDVRVTDSSAKPIEDVIITGTSLSVSGQTTQTDKNGLATIPWAGQKTQWISVAKAGYLTVENIDVEQKKPIRIMLKAK